MKKLMKSISICLMAILCVCASFGCSCEKKLKVRYTASVARENGINGIVGTKLYMESYVEQKFREPASTPCYTKEGTLVTKNGVSSCYTVDGVPFERAVPGKKEKVKLEENRMLAVGYENNEQNEFASEYLKMPDNENYSYIYKFTIINSGDNVIYLTEDCLSEEKIFGGVLKDDVVEKEKLKFNIVNGNKIVDSEKSYYVLNQQEEIIISIELKNLTNKDLNDSRSKTLDIKFDLVVR